MCNEKNIMTKKRITLFIGGMLLLLCHPWMINTATGNIIAKDNAKYSPELSLAVNGTDEKPNVIIILSDDQGYGDFSAHGNPVLKTPALDQLNAESVRFSNFHVAPLCTPTRGQLMTGKDALKNKAATVGKGQSLIRRDLITMPEIFSQNGYQTGLFGKWHLGHNYPDRPMDRGFKKSVWIRGWGLRSEIEYDNDYYQTRYLDSLDSKMSKKYCTNLWFDEAIKWMEKKVEKEQPFFTFLSLNVPHGPFHSPEEDYQFYSDKVDDDKTASFFGMIRNVDQNMAQLEKWLKEKNIRDNTLIVYMTDNGTAQGEDVFNARMRGKKGSNYDGGHRAACLIRWPDGNIGKPRTVDDATQIQDLLPTFIDLLDFSAENHQFDGTSLKPLLEQGKEGLEDRMFVVQFGGNVKPEKYDGAVVWNSWRLVGKNELYDLSNDPGQRQNVAEKHPDVLQRMQKFYEGWWSEVEDDLNQFVPLIIGSDQENPVTLTSDFWAENSVNTQWHVAQAAGDQKGGVWHVEAKQRGTYKVELSRWPFHLDRKLTDPGPDTAVGGTKLSRGKALPIEFGAISLNGREPVIAERSSNATSITIKMDMPLGKNTLQAWFKDEDERNISGAYYLKVEKI